MTTRTLQITDELLAVCQAEAGKYIGAQERMPFSVGLARAVVAQTQPSEAGCHGRGNCGDTSAPPQSVGLPEVGETVETKLQASLDEWTPVKVRAHDRDGKGWAWETGQGMWVSRMLVDEGKTWRRVQKAQAPLSALKHLKGAWAALETVEVTAAPRCPSCPDLYHLPGQCKGTPDRECDCGKAPPGGSGDGGCHDGEPGRHSELPDWDACLG
jgi:hypothetical protein